MVTATPSLTQLDASTTDATYATDATAHVATAEQAVVTKEAAPSTDAELGDAKKGYVPKKPAEPASATEDTIGSLDGFNLAWLAPPPDALHCMEAMSSLASTATTEASQPSSQVSEDADAGADTEGTPPCKKPKSLHVATLVGAVHAPLDDALGGLAPLAAQPTTTGAANVEQLFAGNVQQLFGAFTNVAANPAPSAPVAAVPTAAQVAVAHGWVAPPGDAGCARCPAP